MNSERIYIFDTTLRDGEQAPGASLNEVEKLQIAKALAKLNVDIIEAGFPYSSKGDFSAVKRIASEVEGPIICGLARANIADIESAAKALEPAKKRRIHTFIGSSDIHLKYKLNMTKDECLKRAVSAVSLAKSFTEDVEFSPEDASRSDYAFLFELLTAAIEAGATTINIPDTVGYSIPEEFAKLITEIKKNVKNINKAIISVHCHNDLGLAVANSFAGILNGARQVECAINGMGERAGNCALEEIVMILNTRKENLAFYTNINTKNIIQTSSLISTLSGFPVQKNKAIVGENAFAHESGIHQDGVLKHKETYEIINPETVGIKASSLPLGRRSGKHALKVRLEELSYNFDTEEIEQIYIKFKEIADKKKIIKDQDLISILGEKEREAISEKIFNLEKLQIASGSGLPIAAIEIRKLDDNTILRAAEIGTGPVDAIYKCIKKLIDITGELMEYNVHSVTEGIDAQATVMVRINHNNKIYNGHGLDTDILLASAKAYLNALDKLYAEK